MGKKSIVDSEIVFILCMQIWMKLDQLIFCLFVYHSGCPCCLGADGETYIWKTCWLEWPNIYIGHMVNCFIDIWRRKLHGHISKLKTPLKNDLKHHYVMRYNMIKWDCFVKRKREIRLIQRLSFAEN